MLQRNATAVSHQAQCCLGQKDGDPFAALRGREFIVRFGHQPGSLNETRPRGDYAQVAS